MRGSRTIGGGCSKKRRGAGHKGGRGKAGLGKHHWTWTVKNDPNHFGKYGFKRPQGLIKNSNTVNLGYLDDISEKLLAKGIATKEGDFIVIDVTDLGYDKVLAKGKLLKPLKINSPMFSASAEEKLREAGGKATKL
jgi:large subunit ribosomal protein L15